MVRPNLDLSNIFQHQLARQLNPSGCGRCPLGDPIKSQKGFTLIELLLVLAIIGIISAIAIPALLSQRESARQKATQSAAAAIKGELVAYGEGLRKGGTAPTATGVLAGVTTMVGYVYPSVRNAYSPTLSPYVALASATANGQVALTTLSTVGPDGQNYEAIQISWKHLANSGTAIVAIDM